MVFKNISSGGGTLAVEVTGSGPLVICSPGMGDTRDHYNALASTLTAQGYTVATVDPRGHGDSSVKFSSYGDEATATDFLTVMHELGATRAVLAGTSFGAASATIAAANEPDAIAGVILLGPFLRPGAGKVLSFIFPLFFWKPWGPAMWKYYAGTLWPGLGDGAAKRAKESTSHLTRPGRWAAFQDTVAGLDHSVVAPYIPKVKAAALVIMGDKDPDWSKPAEEAEWIASQFKERDLLIVEGAGHGPALEKPEIVGPAVVKFLNGLKKGENF